LQETYTVHSYKDVEIDQEFHHKPPQSSNYGVG